MCAVHSTETERRISISRQTDITSLHWLWFFSLLLIVVVKRIQIPFLLTIAAIHKQEGNNRDVKGQSTREREREMGLSTENSCFYVPVSSWFWVMQMWMNDYLLVMTVLGLVHTNTHTLPNEHLLVLASHPQAICISLTRWLHNLTLGLGFI